MKFYYKPISNSYNIGGSRPYSAIRFIAIHYTANSSRGADALAHYKYFNNNRTGTSAHYFVDSEKIIQIVGDSTVAYAVGGNQGYGVALNGCTNYNSISIEMCVNSDGNYNQTYFHTVELVKELLRKYPKAIVCRHYDATRKNCPARMAGRNNSEWNKFLNDIKQNRKLIIDLSKDSVAKEIGNVSQNNKHDHKVEGQYFVMTNTPNDILNVREQANATSRIVSAYNHNSKIYVHEVVKNNTGTWYKIEYHKNKFGYVSARYCKGIK